MTRLHSYKISVVIPTYNRAHTLARALTSVVNQTCPVHEVLVVDDCSTDNTEEIALQFPNVTYMRMPRNSGAGAARNRGVEVATGDWIAFLDSDDVWLCNRLEEQVRYLESGEVKSAGLVCSGITVQEKSGNCAYYDFPFVSSSAGWTFSEFQTYPFSTPTWLISKSVFSAVGGFDDCLPNCEDLDFLAKVSKLTSIAVLREPLVVKYNQADSIDADLKRIELSYDILFERHAWLWKACPSAAANSHYRLGNLRARAGFRVAANRSFASAVKWRPLSLKYWLAWLLPYRVLVFVRRLGR